jgi:hypothetical protein
MSDQVKEQSGYKGPQVDHRTPRQRAIEMGTDSAGFKEEVPYDVTHGHPVTKQTPSQEYKEPSLKAPQGGQPVSDKGAPFSLGSK